MIFGLVYMRMTSPYSNVEKSASSRPNRQTDSAIPIIISRAYRLLLVRKAHYRSGRKVTTTASRDGLDPWAPIRGVT